MTTKFQIAEPYKFNFDGKELTRWETTDFSSLEELKEVIKGLEIPRDVELREFKGEKLVSASLLMLEM